MRTRLVLRPGQRGTKKLLAQYGERLLCVRYRYDVEQKKRYKTVELIIEIVDWSPRPRRRRVQRKVLVQIAWGEVALREAVKLAGGRWRPERGAWELLYERVVALGLTDRMLRS